MKNKLIANILIGIIVVVILGVGGYFGFIGLIKKTQKPITPTISTSTEQTLTQETTTTKQTIAQNVSKPIQSKIKIIKFYGKINNIDITNSDKKVIGEKIGIVSFAYEYKDTNKMDDTLLGFFDKNSMNVISTLTLEDFLKNCEEDKDTINPQNCKFFYTIGKYGEYAGYRPLIVHDILYNKQNSLFLVVIELTFSSGATSNKSWNFYFYDEKENKFYTTNTLLGGGFLPKNFVFSPDGMKLAYITGGTGGWCANRARVEGIDIRTLLPLKLESIEFEKFAFKESNISKIFWKNNSIIIADYHVDFCEGGEFNVNKVDKTFEFSVK